jgi:Ser/Thr protein kinase RdoA (MazF antagonist)
LPVQVVHGDPAFDAFILDGARVEEDGMVDWSATMGAPVLYDLGTVAAACRGHPDRLSAFLRGYLGVDPTLAGQVQRLGTFTRLRWMCTAVYFADRIDRGIERNASPSANRLGLAEAYAQLNLHTRG